MYRTVGIDGCGPPQVPSIKAQSLQQFAPLRCFGHDLNPGISRSSPIGRSGVSGRLASCQCVCGRWALRSTIIPNQGFSISSHVWVPPNTSTVGSGLPRLPAELSKFASTRITVPFGNLIGRSTSYPSCHSKSYRGTFRAFQYGHRGTSSICHGLASKCMCGIIQTNSMSAFTSTLDRRTRPIRIASRNTKNVWCQ